MTFQIILLGFSLSLCLACSPTKNHRFYVPPGCVRLNDSTWIDQRPLQNLDYWEYLGWTMQVYGRPSPEFTAAFPDTSGHGELVKYALSDQDTMPQHKTYFVPKERFEENLCCISLKQLSDYCRWRTELVYWKQQMHRNKCLNSSEKHLIDAAVTFWKNTNPEQLKGLPNIAVYSLPDTLIQRAKNKPAERIPAAVQTHCRFISALDYWKGKQ